MTIKRTGIWGTIPDPFPYNRHLADWWRERADDGPHRRAYQTIAAFIGNSLPRPPGHIVDYACGAGQLIVLLGRLFPQSRLTGIDASAPLLSRAAGRLDRLPEMVRRRISLLRSALPLERPFRPRASLAVYCFPNMIPAGADTDAEDGGFGLSSRELKLAERLACHQDNASPRTDRSDVGAALSRMRFARRISRDLHHLLIRNGLCIRVEYAAARRDEWSAPDLLQAAFEEGSLEYPVDGIRTPPCFRVLASAFYRSKVMEDVYAQSGDEGDRTGGFMITVLRAI